MPIVYLAVIDSARRCWRNWRSLVVRNLWRNASSWLKLWTTRTPESPSWNDVSVPPTRSRSSTYAAFEARRNQLVSLASTGTPTSTPSASCQLMATMTTMAPTNTRLFTMNIDRPCDTSSWSESTSAVMRETSVPVRVRS